MVLRRNQGTVMYLISNTATRGRPAGPAGASTLVRIATLMAGVAAA